MIRVFLDANVYFSAARSKSGGSAAVLELAKSTQLRVFATSIILREAERNIRLKEPQNTRLRFYEIVKECKAKLVTIDKRQAEKRYLPLINRKDTYVLEGARKAQVDYLLTFDKRHFMNRKMKTAVFPFKILRPGHFIRTLASK